MPGVPGVLTPPVEVRELAYFNTASLALILVFPPWFFLWYTLFGQPDAAREQIPALGRQIALARNGQRVLQVLHCASLAPARGNSTPPKRWSVAAAMQRSSTVGDEARAGALVSGLQDELPWLPGSSSCWI